MADIFVSYAHVDNEPLLATENGWVSTFVEKLENILGRELGRSDAYSLWMDDELRGKQSITPGIVDELDQAHILLLFMSAGYRESTWCQKELELFQHQSHDRPNRIFLVELTEIDKPTPLSDLKGYPFWVKKKGNRKSRRPVLLANPRPNPEREPEYFEYLTELARDLCEEIQLLRSSSANSNATETRFEHTVYLAQVPHSLHAERENVRRYLEQLHVRVIPRGELPVVDYENAVNDALKDADLFVQLLDEDPGFTFPQIQYECSVNHELPAMQWRREDLDPGALDDIKHAHLLQGSEVIAASLTDFRDMVKKKLFKPEPKAKPVYDNGELFVFIDAPQHDMKLARETSKCLGERGIGYSLPPPLEEGATAKELRTELEENLIISDAIMMIFPSGPVRQLREHLRHCQRLKAKRDKPIRVIAAFIDPERDPDSLNINLRELEFFNGSPVANVETFLKAAQV